MKHLKKINIDIIRLILAFMVVAIHIYPLSNFNETLDYTFTRIIFRIAVPLFLMLTGYFILPKSLKDKTVLKDYTKKILKIYLISILIYLPINFYNGYFKNFSMMTLLKDIFIDGTFYHLWYFPALILGIWTVYFLITKFDRGKIQFIVILLFIIGLFGDSYYNLVSNIKFISSFYQLIFNIFTYTRNGLLFVPIFLYMGYQFNNHNNLITVKKNIVLIFIYLMCMTIEGLILFYFKVPKHNSMYIFLIPLTYYLFNLLINHYTESNKKIRFLATLIYILHPLFIVIFRFLFKIMHLEKLISNNLIQYLFVSIFTTIFIIFINKIKEVVKNER